MMEVKLTTVLEKIDKLETLTDNLLDIIKKYPKDLEAQEYLKNYGISLEIFQQCFGELEILKTNIKNELNDVKIESKYF
jgi:hypothetical protein